jgi:hypothetical protein
MHVTVFDNRKPHFVCHCSHTKRSMDWFGFGKKTEEKKPNTNSKVSGSQSEKRYLICFTIWTNIQFIVVLLQYGIFLV